MTKTMNETTLDFTKITVSDRITSPRRVLGEYSFRVHDTDTTVRFRVETPLYDGQFSCAVSHICQDAATQAIHPNNQHGALFTADTPEGALQKALDHFAAFITSPDARNLLQQDRLRRNQDWLVTAVRVG